MMRNNGAIRAPFLQGLAGTVIVLPSPHGDYKRGISYSDACAAGEIYSCFNKLKNLDVRTPESLGLDISKNLVLLAGKKANPIARDLQSSGKLNSNFDLDDGVIHDKEKSVVVTPQYARGGTSIDHVKVDYGLIVYANNPFGESTKVLHVAGIRGCGTLAAAIAISDGKYVRKIEKLLRKNTSCGDPSQLENKTIEILVRISATNGRVLRDSLSIEKITVSDGSTTWKWESEEYAQLQTIVPHKLHIDVINKPSPSSPIIRMKIDDREIGFLKSPDRLKILYVLAEQARTDYLTQSPNGGWVSAYELAEKVWQIKVKNGAAEIPAEIRREVSTVLIAWARDMQKQGKLQLDADRLDRDYINSEILVFDSQIKKKIADLVYLINQDERNRSGLDFQIIESQSGLGYRLNVHPALVFCAHTEKSA